MGGNPVEGETGRKRTAEFTQAFEGRFPTAIATNLELPGAGDRHIDLVAFLQVKGIDHRGWQPNGETVSPLRYLHG
jgi:hypothetical protein